MVWLSGKPRRGLLGAHAARGQLLVLARPRRQQDERRVRDRQHREGPLAVRRDGHRVALAQAHDGRAVGLAHEDRVVRAARLAFLVEEERLRVRREVGREGVVEERHVALARVALRAWRALRRAGFRASSSTRPLRATSWSFRPPGTRVTTRSCLDGVTAQSERLAPASVAVNQTSSPEADQARPPSLAHLPVSVVFLPARSMTATVPASSSGNGWSRKAMRSPLGERRA